MNKELKDKVCLFKIFFQFRLLKDAIKEYPTDRKLEQEYINSLQSITEKLTNVESELQKFLEAQRWN